MLPFDSLQILYRPEWEVLEGRWVTASPAADLPAEYAALLTAARQYKATRWLLDVRRVAITEPDNLRWFVHTYLPEVSTTFAPQPVKLAYWVPQRWATTRAPNDPTPDLGPDYQHHSFACRLGVFLTEGAALAWLRQPTQAPD